MQGKYMGLLNKLIGKLPASKKNIDDINNRLDALSRQLDSLQAEDARLFSRIVQADDGINNNVNFRSEWLDSRMDSQSVRLETMLWEIYRGSDETTMQAKRRFFNSLPKATGGLRQLQKGCAALLGEFHQLCQQNGLDYWVAFGTLLGAVRHEGFIPWDDDVDLGMTRSDIQRLEQLLEGSPDYRVSLIYDSWNFCKQVRFMRKDETNPCFLDLFIFEEVDVPTPSTYRVQKELRRKMVQEFRTAPFFDEWRQIEFAKPSWHLSEEIERVFEKYRALAVQEGCLSPSDGVGLVWGIENYDNPDDPYQCEWICDKKEIFPLRQMPFEDIVCNAPNDPMKSLREVYGDIYRVPKDMTIHVPHVSYEQLQKLESES